MGLTLMLLLYMNSLELGLTFLLNHFLEVLTVSTDDLLQIDFLKVVFDPGIPPAIQYFYFAAYFEFDFA